jgi:hypothetical protein
VGDSQRRNKMSDWKSDLDNLFANKEKEAKITEENISKANAEIKLFLSGIVIPAFEEVRLELEKHQRVVKIWGGNDSASIEISYDLNTEIQYYIKTRIRTDGSVSIYPQTRFRDSGNGTMYVSEGFLRSGSQDYGMAQITKDEIINHLLSEYKLNLRYPKR